MISKLKYVGVRTEDLIEIYILFVRSISEYCSVAFHSSLTQKQSNIIERIQKTALKVILSENYVSYEAALEMCGLTSLYQRREERCLTFGIKAIKHLTQKKMFPLKSEQMLNGQVLRGHETFKVNFARTEAYRRSAVPFIQRKLNNHLNGQRQ